MSMKGVEEALGYKVSLNVANSSTLPVGYRSLGRDAWDFFFLGAGCPELRDAEIRFIHLLQIKQWP
ncbi:MAG: hypothetical protein WBA57_21410 [Elainellaceae cyanobacterium]